MARWFLFFVIYSLFGYCLEKLFAYATRSPRQVRKCFLLLPLCPVYGLAMTAFLALADPAFPFPILAVVGGIVCTAVEYLVHLYYDKVFSTQFWDYSDLSFHIGGRICPHFALVWGILSALAVRYIHPGVESLVSGISPAAAFGIWMVLAADCVFTSALLLRCHDTEMLSIPALIALYR